LDGLIERNQKKFKTDVRTSLFERFKTKSKISCPAALFNLIFEMSYQ
jgi:hypothetical protein